MAIGNPSRIITTPLQFPIAVNYRDWGMFFFLIPVGWLALAILIQRHGHLRFDGPLIFWSGIAVAMGTVIILACIGLSSGASLIQVVE